MSRWRWEFIKSGEFWIIRGEPRLIGLTPWKMYPYALCFANIAGVCGLAGSFREHKAGSLYAAQLWCEKQLDAIVDVETWLEIVLP